jgi:hypothetical protein
MMVMVEMGTKAHLKEDSRWALLLSKILIATLRRKRTLGCSAEQCSPIY